MADDRKFGERFVDNLNTVGINVWAVLILIAGVVLVVTHHPDAGLITGAFALLQGAAQLVKKATGGSNEKPQVVTPKTDSDNASVVGRP